MTMPEHVAEALYDRQSGSFYWSCSCGDRSQPVFPKHAADAEGTAHAATANHAKKFDALHADVQALIAEWRDPETAPPHAVAHQDPRDGMVTFHIRGFHEHLAHILAALRTYQRDPTPKPKLEKQP
jgi:hypothetical protein